MSAHTATYPPSRRRAPAALTFVLAFVIALFIGILVFVYFATRRANPIYVDQQGHPTNQQQPAGTHKAR